MGKWGDGEMGRWGDGEVWGVASGASGGLAVIFNLVARVGKGCPVTHHWVKQQNFKNKS
ncbi:MAG: hypothetical protein F6J90_22055 [Moorea sp. SIOASIH]|uniref:hypothetical protein n=1 Tax=Moorena sp. SIOASIH TaxID=2607817 RepID=UPI0013B971FF|nr:hypothetical protein [Moorena sp. SIOASIH]NEO38875.1 hypothetical protein [Moorena sp. SIOASIH]